MDSEDMFRILTLFMVRFWKYFWIIHKVELIANFDELILIFIQAIFSIGQNNINIWI